MSRHALLLPSLSLLFAVGLAAVACEESSSTPSSSVDGGSSSGGEQEDGGAADATSASDAASASATCEGACKTTAATAKFRATRPFERAQFGVEGDGGAPRYYVEAHAGGDPACPTNTAPSPDFTLILSGIPKAAAGTVITEAAGVTASLVDIKGELLATPKPEKATSVSVTLGAQDPAASPQWIAFDVEAKFPTGTVSGHFYGTRCTIFD